MKVTLNKDLFYKGENHKEGETLSVSARLGGAWIQTGKANVFSKKTVRTSKRKQANESGGKDKSPKVDSKSDD